MSIFFRVFRHVAILFTLLMGVVVSASAAELETRVVVVPLGGSDENAVWAHSNNNSMTKTDTSGQYVVNSMSINVLRDGFLVISGMAYIRNNHNGQIGYVLIPQVDGVNASSTHLSYGHYLANGTWPYAATRNYTITVPISKGLHTISQKIGPWVGTGSWYSANHQLTAMYFPSGSIEGPSAGTLAQPESLQSGGDTPGMLIIE